MAFAMPKGLHHYTVLLFSLHGAPSTFQRLMDRVLRPHSEYSTASLDDVIMYSPNWKSHLKQLNTVLEVLHRADLTTNAKKCRLGQSTWDSPLGGAMSNRKRRKFKLSDSGHGPKPSLR